jgi:hypothetical protein
MAPNRNEEATGGGMLHVKKIYVKKIFDIAKDILNSSSPVKGEDMDKMKEEGDGTGPSFLGDGGDDTEKAEKESDEQQTKSNGRKPRMSRSSTSPLGKSCVMVDMMTGLVLDDYYDEE